MFGKYTQKILNNAYIFFLLHILCFFPSGYKCRGTGNKTRVRSKQVALFTQPRRRPCGLKRISLPTHTHGKTTEPNDFWILLSENAYYFCDYCVGARTRFQSPLYQKTQVCSFSFSSLFRKYPFCVKSRQDGEGNICISKNIRKYKSDPTATPFFVRHF